MLDRLVSFLRELPSGGKGGRIDRSDDPRVAAAALLYHVANADGIGTEVELARLKEILAQTYHLAGAELEALAKAGEEADGEAIDLYAFTSVLNRHLDEEAKLGFIGLMWAIVYADGELHELEDNMLWRVAELLGVDSRDRIAARRRAARAAHAGDAGTED